MPQLGAGSAAVGDLGVLGFFEALVSHRIDYSRSPPPGNGSKFLSVEDCHPTRALPDYYAGC